jgi:hypothetical protein
MSERVHEAHAALESTDDLGPVGPVAAAPGQPPATASRPDVELEVGRYDTYQSNPVPWWISLLWVSFFLFGVIYLITNLIRG